MDRFLIGKGGEDCFIRFDKLNRHGVISGATGTGKTVTLKVITEALSDAGIPVFLSDIKGDLGSLCQKGDSETVAERVQKMNLEDWEPQAYPVEFYDVFAQEGTPVRTTVSEMGPLLLASLLGLNETQSGILNIVFKVADDQGLLLIDLKDLRAMLNEVKDNAKALQNDYGLVSASSVAAIQRGLLTLESQGGDFFFGEPAFDVADFLETKGEKGVISILSAAKLFTYPKLYATFNLWLLSELYEYLTEVGDLEKPRIVFFFDEAHLLFEDAEKVLLDKVEQMIRMFRSKGVGIFFVSQSPLDIPDPVLSQIGNKIQHGMRAYTPREQKNLKAIAAAFRSEDESATLEALSNLGVGEALVSTLDAKAVPTVTQRVLILPPRSRLKIVDPQVKMQLINASVINEKYGEAIDRESAYEILEVENTKEREALEEAERSKAEEKLRQQEARNARLNKSTSQKIGESLSRNIVGSVGREIGRQITRGFLGIFRK